MEGPTSCNIINRFFRMIEKRQKLEGKEVETYHEIGIFTTPLERDNYHPSYHHHHYQNPTSTCTNMKSSPFSISFLLNPSASSSSGKRNE